jgi:predicted short-subunit dehydrogenase-like oxidoreductase (DUF2520 family)
MIERIRIVGARGRVGSALSARLAERGIAPEAPDPELVLLCVPDRAIAGVAAETPPGPWIAHVSGATPLDALDPHVRRFGLHPLQSFSKALGPEQLDGAWGAVTAESVEARVVGRWLAETLGLKPFDLADDARSAYHAGAAMASNFLVALESAAQRMAGVDRELLAPLVRAAVETWVAEGDAALTGPIARGDEETVARHREAIAQRAPELLDLYEALAEATRAVATRAADGRPEVPA